MFTGLVETVAEIISSKKIGQNLVLIIKKPPRWKLKVGDSVAVDGTCLTVVKTRTNNFSVALTPETLAKTSFGGTRPKKVNLERPLRLNSLVGGHLVLGHIDTVGRIVSLVKDKKGVLLKISFSKSFARLVVPKGSIALDGVSLTVVVCSKNTATIALIPHTVKHTTLGFKKIGDTVNIEFDIIGKYTTRRVGL